MWYIFVNTLAGVTIALCVEAIEVNNCDTI